MHAWPHETFQPSHPVMLTTVPPFVPQYTFHTHFYYHHSLSTPPCIMSFLISSSLHIACPLIFIITFISLMSSCPYSPSIPLHTLHYSCIRHFLSIMFLHGHCMAMHNHVIFISPYTQVSYPMQTCPFLHYLSLSNHNYTHFPLSPHPFSKPVKPILCLPPCLTSFSYPYHHFSLFTTLQHQTHFLSILSLVSPLSHLLYLPYTLSLITFSLSILPFIPIITSLAYSSIPTCVSMLSHHISLMFIEVSGAGDGEDMHKRVIGLLCTLLRSHYWSHY